MSIEQEDVIECIHQRGREYNLYYQTVKLTLGIKSYLDKSNIGCRFVSAEPILYNLDKTLEINPDIILQYDDDKKGILCEIKTSVTLNELHFVNKMFPQIEKYCNDVLGWDNDTNKVDNHDILCLIHMVDSDRVISLMENAIEKNELIVSKNLCISDFSIMQSPKLREGDIILIKYRYGTLGCDNLENELKQNIKINMDDLQENYEICKFTRKEPPIEYIIDHLWTFILNTLAPVGHERDYEIDLQTILDLMQEYYTPWTGLKGERSQIRETWIKKALKALIEIKLVEEISEDPPIYKILYGTNIPMKDFKGYILKRICQNTIKRSKKRKISDTQKKITELIV